MRHFEHLFGHKKWLKAILLFTAFGMKNKIQVIPSGISLVDNAWGGFYKGGTYFLIGQRKSGRTLLGIQYAKECALQKEVCIFFTTMRPKDLMISAASINFDLQHYMDQNLIIVVRAALPKTESKENRDEYLSEYLSDLANLVEQYQPAKIIFDELTPFIDFNDAAFLKESFLQAAEIIEENNITSLYILSEPITTQTKNLVNSITSIATGIIYLQKEDEENGGVMTIVPNVGHTEGQFSANYFLEPNKGILSGQQLTTASTAEKSKPRDASTTQELLSGMKYRSLSDMELPKEETFFFYNFYNFEEFCLMLENQIAVYKTTGQKFSVVSLKLDQEAEELQILTLEQLKNSIRLATDKKDKISTIDNKILVILTKIEDNSLNILLARIKANLPVNKPEYAEKVLKYISVYQIIIDKDIENADEILNKLLFDGKEKKSKLHIS